MSNGTAPSYGKSSSCFPIAAIRCERSRSSGSLLEFVLEADNYSFPVGRVEFLYLGPMTFEEYLSGTGNESAVDLLQQVSVEKPFNEAIHTTLPVH